MVVVNVKQEPGLPKQPIVQMGKLGDIKRLMRHLSKRESYIDLDLVCSDGKLGCHKFIIGAQSKYLRRLILNANPDGERCQIHFPDVQRAHMEVVLKFLYTGKLGITEAIKNIVRELLEDILHIDAKVSLPDTIALPGKPGSKRKDDDKGPGGSSAGGESKDEKDRPPKRHRPEEESDENNKSNGNKSDKANDATETTREVKKSSGIIDNSAAPPTPPHDVEYCKDDDDVEILPTPPKPVPEYVDLDDDDDIVAVDSPFGDKVICQAPGIISKKTGGPVMGTPIGGGRGQPIIPAPRCVAKSTGYHPKNMSSIDVSHLFEQGLANGKQMPFRMAGQLSKFTVKKRVEDSTMAGDPFSMPIPPPITCPNVPMPPNQLSDRKTRIQTGAMSRSRFDDEGYDEENIMNDGDYIPKSLLNHVELNDEEMFPLPPPLPLPPNEGMVVKRGKWVREGPPSSAPKKSRGKMHKYHFSPYTISGKTKEQTFANISAPEGYFPCDQCSNVYNKMASLIKHKGRMHNPNLTVQCPECPRKLSHRSALAKHLLSHRPEDQWPYVCEFCGKYFQAKADLPKHWFTYKHKDDRERGIIPAPGSELWFVILHRSARFSLNDMMKKSGIVPANEPILPLQEDQIKEEDDEDNDLLYEPEVSVSKPDTPTASSSTANTLSSASMTAISSTSTSTSSAKEIAPIDEKKDSDNQLPPVPQMPLPLPPNITGEGGSESSSIFSNFGISDILENFKNNAPLSDLDDPRIFNANIPL